MALLILFIVAFLSPLSGQIIEANHFKEIITHITKDTLVLLDIDDTLLIPKQMLGCGEWFKGRWNEHQKNGKSSSEALEIALAEFEAIRHLSRMNIVEPGTDIIIQELQQKKFHVMGFTTQGLALATRTVQQLYENKIDLSISAPWKDDHYLEVNEHGTLYRKGVFFTSGRHKGDALFKLCKQMNYLPKRIVFINDKASQLLEVEEAAKKQGIEFIGLRYAYSDRRKASFRHDIANLQLSYSSLDHLMSDAEACNLLRTVTAVASQ